MEYRVIESTGTKVPLFGVGCMRFPADGSGVIDRRRAAELVDAAMKGGAAYFDTAHAYNRGDNEKALGDALKGYKRDSFLLATKQSMGSATGPDMVKRRFDESLQRLHTDHIDFYLLHALSKPHWESTLRLGLLEPLLELKSQGAIGHLGFSFHDKYEVFASIIDHHRWDFCYLQLNYMDMHYQAGIAGYRLAAAKNIPVMAMEPLKGGTLAKIPAELEHALADIPGAAPTTPAALGLRWTASLPNVKVVLSGVQEVAQIEENVGIFSPFIPLDEAEQGAVTIIAAELAARSRNNCTGCGYCMPCPQGVNIPLVFNLWNDWGRHQAEAASAAQWGGRLFPWTKPPNCVFCGACETLCPQHIDIREDLVRCHAEMENLARHPVKRRLLDEDEDRVVSDAGIPWEELRGGSVLVTGATGLIGSAVVRALAAANRSRGLDIDIIAAGRNRFRGAVLAGRDGVRFLEHDVRRPLSLGGKLDFILHGAAATKSRDMVEKPAEVIETALAGAENILALAREKGVRGLVYLSSLEVYGRTEPSANPVREEHLGHIDLGNPRSCYPESKRMCECLCNCWHSQYGLPAKSARLAQTFGAGTSRDESRVFGQFARSALAGENIVLHTDGNSRGNYCYIADAVAGLLFALLRGNAGEAYNIVNPEAGMTIRQMANLVAEKVAGGRISVVVDKPPDGERLGYAPDTALQLSADKLLRLGWRPRYGLEEMYQRMIACW